jgi:hypothetical protein
VDRTWAILRPVFIPFGPYVQSHWPYSALGSSSSPVLIPSRGLLLTSSFRSKPTYLLPLLLLDRIRRNRGRVFSTPPPPPPPVPPLRPRYSPLPLDSASAPPLTLADRYRSISPAPPPDSGRAPVCASMGCPDAG